MHNPPPLARMLSPIQVYLERLHAQLTTVDAGEVASYIPELAKADPSGFGIAIATVDGQVYEVGTTRRTFTVQSISKPLVYGAALEDRGAERLQQAIGVEPSGDAFNSISLEPGTGRPLNPMINAGAIATASLIAGDTPQARLQRVLDAVSAYAGRALAIDEAVYRSESATGHRNRAIGHMLRNHGIIADDPEPALQLYFQQCSILADCRDLALIAATLANGGINPVSGVRAVRSEFIAPMLSVMTTCGMYDFAGEWVHRVGLPAKSGVGGGVIAVLPGQLGIGVFSPRLDARGNSVRGVQACQAISRDLGLHFLLPPRPSVSTVRARYSLANVRSKRRWPPAQTRVLDEYGARVAVYELQGDLRFATIEPLLRTVDGDVDAQAIVLDFKRVTHADAAATRMLAALVASCGARGRHVVLTRVRRGELLADFGSELDPRWARAVTFQPQLDLGLEWCERLLVARHPSVQAMAVIERLGDHRLCEGVAADDIAQLEACVTRVAYESGATIVKRGDVADALYLLLRGEVSVVIDLPQGGVKRLATLSAGATFGEAALIAGRTRSADVRADSAVECGVLSAADFERLQRERPSLMVRLLHNLLRSSTETAVRLTGEVAALEG